MKCALPRAGHVWCSFSRNLGGLAASLEQASICSDDEVRAELARQLQTFAVAEPTFYGLVDGRIREVVHVEQHDSERTLGSVDGAVVDSLRVCRHALEVRTCRSGVGLCSTTARVKKSTSRLA